MTFQAIYIIETPLWPPEGIMTPPRSPLSLFQVPD